MELPGQTGVNRADFRSGMTSPRRLVSQGRRKAEETWPLCRLQISDGHNRGMLSGKTHRDFKTKSRLRRV